MTTELIKRLLEKEREISSLKELVSGYEQLLKTNIANRLHMNSITDYIEALRKRSHKTHVIVVSIFVVSIINIILWMLSLSLL